MRTKIRKLLLACGAAIAVTLVLFAAAYLASQSHEGIARVLYWQGYWLQSLVPAANIGTPEHPLYEANPVHVAAFFAGIPLGMVVYFLLALVMLRFIGGDSVSPNNAFKGRRAKRARP